MLRKATEIQHIGRGFSPGVPMALGLLALVASVTAHRVSAAQSPQVPITGSAIPRFAQPLPTLSVQPNGTIKTVLGNAALELRMCEFQAKVLPPGTFVAGQQPLTWVWGYLVDPAGGASCASLVDLYDDGVTNGSSLPLDTYVGPVIVSQRGPASTDVTWVNDLGSAATTQILAYRYSTDQTLHWADPFNLGCSTSLLGMPPPFGSPCAANYLGPVAAVTHLHGGEVPAPIDGSPDSWFTSDGAHQGHKYYSFAGAAGNEAIYRYPNLQEAAPLWFHDHTLGATRLNVHAGLAGVYYVEDPGLVPTTVNTTAGVPGTCTQDCLPANLHPLASVIPLVIQDRMFDTGGQLFFQADSAGGVLWSPNAEHPYWSPELVGDTIVVNGKAWPYADVEPRRHRFLLLNGSNARAFNLSLPGKTLWVIGTDGGYLDAPVPVRSLLMQPGERYSVIVDFAGSEGKDLILRNTARHPFPNGAPPAGNTVGLVLQFRVGPGPVVDSSYDPASGLPLRTGPRALVRLADPANGTLAPGVTPARIRQLTLNEVIGAPATVIDPVTGVPTDYPGGPLEVLVNNTKWSGLAPGGAPRADFLPITVNGVTTYYSEIPREGDTEIWEVVNLTADAHPIHLHLVQFQLVNRQSFDVNRYTRTYAAAFPTGVFQPAHGPPLDYVMGNPRALGGNPDVVPFLQGPARPPPAHESGWKDTVIMYPGQVTRIAVRWAPTDLPTSAPAADLHYPFEPTGDGHQFNYVWHCHIIDHEDNEMMRPAVVEANPAAPAVRPLLKGVHY